MSSSLKCGARLVSYVYHHIAGTSSGHLVENKRPLEIKVPETGALSSTGRFSSISSSATTAHITPISQQTGHCAIIGCPQHAITNPEMSGTQDSEGAERGDATERRRRSGSGAGGAKRGGWSEAGRARRRGRGAERAKPVRRSESERGEARGRVERGRAERGRAWRNRRNGRDWWDGRDGRDGASVAGGM